MTRPEGRICLRYIKNNKQFLKSYYQLAEKHTNVLTTPTINSKDLRL